MITYFKMKKNEWKVKGQLYGFLAALMDKQKDIAALMQRLYAALKDVPADELRNEFTSKLASIIHEENQKEKAD